MKKHLIIFIVLLTGINASARNKWLLETEDSNSRLTMKGDTIDLVTPKGATLWYDERLEGDVEISYWAQVVDQGTAGDRLSDLNCFWMATDPGAKSGSIKERMKWRKGVFNNCYSLSLYYMGYGGNSNSTTRFRRYDGDYDGFAKLGKRPEIIKEYTDKAHLLKANHWYHIRITTNGFRTRYYIDDELLVDYADPEPLRSGWFGFRTTWSHTRITRFEVKRSNGDGSIALQFIGKAPAKTCPTTWGVPFRKGEVNKGDAFTLTTSKGNIAHDFRPIAMWDDGSVKWGSFSALIPKGADDISLKRGAKKEKSPATLHIATSEENIIVNTGKARFFIARNGRNVIDSIVTDGRKVASEGFLTCSGKYVSHVKSATVERSGHQSCCIKIEGSHSNGSRQWLPFTLRLYLYGGSEEMKMVHTFVYDGNQENDRISSLGFHLRVPMEGEAYNRHVAFTSDNGGVWSEPIQPLVGRRLPVEPELQRRQMEGETLPSHQHLSDKTQELITHWARWNDFRLSQLNDGSFTIRKRANKDNPWIGTTTGKRSNGFVFVGTTEGGIEACMHDFWQTYPSTIEVTDCTTPEATLTMWLWSPEAEAMNLTHYDNTAHGLDASYEDVQEGMSTPYGIAHTTTFTIVPSTGYKGKEWAANESEQLANTSQLMCTPQYLHDTYAFGIWSLPEQITPTQKKVEEHLESFITLYKDAIEQHHWYGFWNYGDVMHAYDPVRHSWRYDVGGYAWDNTELASNMWLWYSFLRTGREDIWRMAEAMTRHTGETDVYHLGTNRALGSRHNVSHWGCGAKEARISQAAWNRFYYYLTGGDERCGELIDEVTDADTMLLHIDPMRLAQPRSLYPCTAPARLRIGPDWMAYAGNWMTRWERTCDTRYRDKIVAGMKSIANLRHGLFTGPKALGYYPQTGIITCECDTSIQNTNHLMTIMGGFEVMNELMETINLPEWNRAWLDHATNYKRKAMELSNSKFRVSRLGAYAAFVNRDKEKATATWNELLSSRWLRGSEMKSITPPYSLEPLTEMPTISTNDVATWALDAIYMLEVIPM